MNIIFTHLFISGFGWENTIYQQEDFKEIELLGENEKDGKIFIAVQDNGKIQILKGYHETA